MRSFIKEWFWKTMSLPVELLAYTALALFWTIFAIIFVSGFSALAVGFFLIIVWSLFPKICSALRAWYLSSVEVNRIFKGEKRMSYRMGLPDSSINRPS